MKRKDFISKACALAAAVFIPLGKLVAKQNDNSAGIWHVLLEYARWCPSPHNVQPWKVKIISAAEAHLYYDPARVPIMVDEHAAFTTAGIGMFLECIAIVARSKGYKVRVAHQPEATLDCSGTQFRLFATMSLLLANETEEISPELIKERRTSRGKYDGRIISSPLTDNFKKIASDSGYDFLSSSIKCNTLSQFKFGGYPPNLN